jgi:dTDP-4-dehydrorhamnose reductase
VGGVLSEGKGVKLLVIGGTGYVGRHLTRLWTAKDHVVHTTGCVQHNCDFTLDLTDADVDKQIAKLMAGQGYDAVVFAAGLTDRTLCEQNKRAALVVNGMSVGQIAHEAHRCQFVYLSDAYVFDGHERAAGNGRFTEKDNPAPKSVYAKSKRLGEVEAMKQHAHPLIVRTGGVYGPACPLFEWLRTVATPGMRVPLWHDRTFSPTYVGDLARAIELMLLRQACGIYHVAGASQNRAQWLLRVAVNLGIVTTNMESHSAPDDCLMPKNLSLWIDKLKGSENTHSHTSNMAQCVGRGV